MKFSVNKKKIPAQKKGIHSDTKKEKKFTSSGSAKVFFKEMRKRLLYVSKWHLLCGLSSATFTLTDANGNNVKRLAKEGDHFKISIPGPVNKNGEGYDWVKILSIENTIDANEDREAWIMIVQPAQNPLDKKKKPAHFFTSDATSTFIVSRNKNVVADEVHGRNELPNLDQEDKINSLRNAVVAIGAMLGFSKMQWKRLVKGIISH